MTRALLLTACLLATAAPALAQEDRVERIDRQLKELRAIVFQGRETGQPVVVKPAGPDPSVTELQQKVGDLEQTLQRVNGQLDGLTQSVEELKRTAGDARGAASANADQIRALTDRVGRLETQLAPAPAAPAAPPPQAAAAPPASAPPPEAAPPPTPTTRRGRAAAATARAQAEDQGALGGPAPAAAPAAPPKPASEAATYKEARRLLAAGDYAAATAALQDYGTRFPTGPHASDARYHLGEALFLQDNYPEAARNYALALRGWPKVSWAPDATLKLAQSLAALNRPADACAAASEFQTRYGAAASAPLRARLASVQAKAKCAG